MKRRLVLNVIDLKSRDMALKIVNCFPGVESVSFKGDDETQIEIIVDDMVDVVWMERILKEGLGYAVVVYGGPTGAGSEKKKETTADDMVEVVKLMRLLREYKELVSVSSAGAGCEKKEEEPKTHAGEPKPNEILCSEIEMEMGKQELQERGLESELESGSLEANLQESHEYEIPISEVPSKKSEFIFLIINILLELLSVVFDHLSSVYKHRYALLAMVTSFVAVIICIMELSYKAGKERVVLRWKSKLPWFYHSSPNHRRFGTVLEMTGLIFAILQTISSTVAYILYLTHVKYTFNLSLLPLVLAMSLFCSKFMQKTNPGQPSKISDNTELTEIHVKTS